MRTWITKNYRTEYNKHSLEQISFITCQTNSYVLLVLHSINWEMIMIIFLLWLKMIEKVWVVLAVYLNHQMYKQMVMNYSLMTLMKQINLSIVIKIYIQVVTIKVKMILYKWKIITIKINMINWYLKHNIRITIQLKFKFLTITHMNWLTKSMSMKK